MIPLIKDLIMKMRAGRLTGISAQPEALPALHLHSLHHSDGFHVRISCLITEAMVHHHLVSVAEKFEFHRLHHAVTCGIYGIAWFKGEIHARMPGRPAAERVRPVAEAA